MRLAALGLGLLGSIVGFFGGLFVILVGSVGTLFAAEGSGTVALLGLLALGASTLGVVGAVFAVARPRLAAAFMAGGAVIGVLAVSLAYIPAAILLAVAAFLAFMGRRASPQPYIQQYR